MNEEKNELRLLAEAQKAFTDWRKSKKLRSEPIPDKLLGMAFALLTHFPASRIAKALRLSLSDFKRRAQAAGFLEKAEVPTGKSPSEPELEPKPEPETTSTTFVEIPPSASSAGPKFKSDQEQRWRLIWSRADGSRLEIQPPVFCRESMAAVVLKFLG